MLGASDFRGARHHEFAWTEWPVGHGGPHGNGQNTNQIGGTMKILSTLAVALLLACSNALAAERTLKIAATEYPPYYGTDMEGQGFITEIIVEAFKRSGYDLDIKFLPWKRALEGTKAGKHDGLFTVWYRAEREEWFLFSKPLPANEVGFFRRADNDISSSDYAALKDRKIGVVRGYASPPGFDDAGLKTAEAKDDEENLRKLQKGRIDLALVDKILGQHIINAKLSGSAAEFAWIDPPVQVDEQFLVISKKAADHEAILAAFNEGLAAIEADGTLKAIMARRGF